MSTRYKYALLATIAALVFGFQPASAKTLLVTQNMGNPCLAGDTMFSTIQSAVNAASRGDIVAVCNGSYPEQVSIIRGITLEAATGQTAVNVTVPNGGVVQNTTSLGSGFPIAAQILVAPALPRTTVNIKNLTVDGTGNNLNSCALDLEGIYYQNAGGTISGNTVENQLLPPPDQGCQDGLAILVENNATGTGKVTISQNTVTNFDKNGITVDLGAATALITKNTVTGLGPTDVIAQNGIQVAYGATATITTNTVSNLIYSPGTAGSSGILLYDTQYGTYLTPPAVTGNTVTSAQYGVVLDAVNGASGALLKVTGNKIKNAQFAGVGLYSDSPGNDDYIDVASNNIQNTSPYDGIDACSSNNTINGNTVINSPAESAMHLDGLCSETGGSGQGNTVTNNHLEVACVGILVGPAQNLSTNTITLAGAGKNIFTDVTTDVLYGQDTDSCGPTHLSGGASGAAHPGRFQPSPQ